MSAAQMHAAASTSDAIQHNLDEVRGRIASACRRSGRNPSDVTLVAATKYVGAAEVRTLADLGVRDIGENRVADVEAKAALVPGVRWHMIGRLQRNKASRAARLIDVVHSVDSAALATALDRAASGRGSPLRVLLEVNVAGEASKAGIRPEDTAAMAEEVRRLRHLSLDGLMAMTPLTSDPEESRPYFQALARLAEVARLPHLSMGMSQDYEVAVEEGATFVRVGAALFQGTRI